MELHGFRMNTKSTIFSVEMLCASKKNAKNYLLFFIEWRFQLYELAMNLFVFVRREKKAETTMTTTSLSKALTQSPPHKIPNECTIFATRWPVTCTLWTITAFQMHIIFYSDRFYFWYQHRCFYYYFHTNNFYVYVFFLAKFLFFFSLTTIFLFRCKITLKYIDQNA